MYANIYSPSKNPVQSGIYRLNCWILIYALDPNMKGRNNIKTQIKIKFDSKESAISFAVRNKIKFILCEPNIKKIHKISYSENFSHNRNIPWTH